MDKHGPIKENVLADIARGKIAMRPRWHFALRTALGVMGATLLVGGVLYLISFAVFILHQTGVWFVPVFGSRGWYEFFARLPWLLIACSLLFVAILEILVRHFAFGWRRTVLPSLIGLTIALVAGGLLVAQTPLHDAMFRSARERKLPVAGQMYRAFGSGRLERVHRGVIVEDADDGFIMRDRRDEILHVILSPETNFPHGADFGDDDTIVVFGSREDHTIRAIGITAARNMHDIPAPRRYMRRTHPFLPFAPR